MENKLKYLPDSKRSNSHLHFVNNIKLMPKCKRSQSSIIAIIVIILIVIIALIVFWNIYNPLVTKQSQNINADSLNTNIQIKEVSFYATGAYRIKIERLAGNDKLDSFIFIFEDENQSIHTETITENLPEPLESKIYYFSPIENFGKIKKISVFPVIGGKQGIGSSLDYNNIIEIPPGLVGWFRFRDSYDDSAGKNIGVGYGTINLTESEGRKGVYFDSGYIDLGNDISLNLKKTFAISFWIKTDYKEGTILEKGSTNPSYKIFITDSGRMNFSFSDSGNTENKESLSIIADGKWHNLVVTNMAIYLDGKADNIINLNNQFDTNEESLIIGEGFKGYISDLMIYNESLDNSQVKSIFYLYR